MRQLFETAKEIGEVDISDDKWKMSVACSEGDTSDAEQFKMQIELHEV